VVKVSLLDDHKRPMQDVLGGRMLVKLPYKGRAVSQDRIEVLTSTDGQEIHRIDPNDVLLFVPAGSQTGEGVRLPGSNMADETGEDGYVIFLTDKPGYFAVVDL